MATEEITISELELADEVLADMTLPVDTATETRAVTLKQLRAWLGSSLPTGFIIPAVGKISDERFTLLDGKTLSRAGTYEAFCNKVVSEVQEGNWFACSEDEYAQDLLDFGQCGKFVVSNDYIRIPTITRFIGATITLSEIGKTYKESLPNITVSFETGVDGFASFTEAFSSTSDSSRTEFGRDVATSAKQTISFNASRSSSAYQDGAKVQPDHTKYPYYMVVSTEGQTAKVEIDINKVYEDLNIKANSDLSNASSVASSFKKQSVSWAMPSGKYIQYTDLVTETSSYYSITADAVADGYFSMSASMNSTGGTLDISNHTTGMKSKVEAPQNNHHIGCFLPVKKGDRVKCGLNTSTEWWIRFYYAEGEK
nr:MAG TPA: hypothetical protein [Caudoviricetes sp.]